LGVPPLLDHQLQRRIRRGYDLALFHELKESGVLDQLGLGKTISPEKKGTPYEGKCDGKEDKTAPIQLWILTPVLALAVVIGWFGIFF
jgi:hypothetical protein